MVVTENTFAALCRDFQASSKFKALAPATQDGWGRELNFACDPRCLGSTPLDLIRPALVQGYLDGWDDKPGKQRAALAAFHALEKWALVRDLLNRPITLGVEAGGDLGGHIPWTDAQVAHAETYARADLARAITLGAATGQRVSDLVRMGPTDVEHYKSQPGINVAQQKTGRRVWIPISDKLGAAMTTWERRPRPFLLRADGLPWRPIDLSKAWRYERDHNPKLKDYGELVLHGLRGHCCVRLARSGLNDHQISDLVGMSIPMVGRYTRLSHQRDNALAAVDGTLGERRIAKSKIYE